MCNNPGEPSMKSMAWAWDSVPHGCSLMNTSSSASRRPALHALLRLRTCKGRYDYKTSQKSQHVTQIQSEISDGLCSFFLWSQSILKYLGARPRQLSSPLGDIHVSNVSQGHMSRQIWRLRGQVQEIQSFTSESEQWKGKRKGRCSYVSLLLIHYLSVALLKVFSLFSLWKVFFLFLGYFPWSDVRSKVRDVVCVQIVKPSESNS